MSSRPICFRKTHLQYGWQAARSAALRHNV
jgi:hypothetical protein